MRRRGAERSEGEEVDEHDDEGRLWRQATQPTHALPREERHEEEPGVVSVRVDSVGCLRCRFLAMRRVGGGRKGGRTT